MLLGSAGGYIGAEDFRTTMSQLAGFGKETVMDCAYIAHIWYIDDPYMYHAHHAWSIHDLCIVHMMDHMWSTYGPCIDQTWTIYRLETLTKIVWGFALNSVLAI